MPDELSRQTIVDDEHLKVLWICYIVSAAVSALFSVIGLFYMAMGMFMGAMISQMPNNGPGNNQPPPAFVGWLFGGIGFVFFLLMIAIGLLKLRAAFCIKQRKSRTFCMIVAAICCLGIPYGTLLGVFTFLVLGRGSVMSQFAEARPLNP